MIVAFGGGEERGENALASWDTSWECPSPAPKKKRNRVQSGCFKGSLKGGRLKTCFVFSSPPRLVSQRALAFFSSFLISSFAFWDEASLQRFPLKSFRLPHSLTLEKCFTVLADPSYSSVFNKLCHSSFKCLYSLQRKQEKSVFSCFLPTTEATYNSKQRRRFQEERRLCYDFEGYPNQNVE